MRPMTCPTLNRLQKSDGFALKKLNHNNSDHLIWLYRSLRPDGFKSAEVKWLHFSTELNVNLNQLRHEFSALNARPVNYPRCLRTTIQ